MTDAEGISSAEYLSYRDGAAEVVSGGVIAEGSVCIFVNGEELASFLCTPRDLDELAIGFLRSEGFIEGLADIESLTLSQNDTCVDVILGKEFDPPARRFLTSGCGGGVTFDDLSGGLDPVTDDVTVSPEQVAGLMRQLNEASELYREVRGVHTGALSNGDRLVVVAQDVGRHNTIDRLWGKALKAGLDPAGHILASSGRISSEMVTKAAKMGIPVAVSRTSPTSLSVRLAEAWNVTLIGYARGSRFRIYAHPERMRIT
jgi:FdhD protein